MFNKLNILKVFFEEPTREFNVREIARILRISPATASFKLKNLVKETLLSERMERTFHLYKADMESEAYKDFKIFYNIKKIKDSDLIFELNKFYLKPTIVLFGSMAAGLDTDASDIDILVISEKTDNFPQQKKFEKKLNKKLQLSIVKEIKDIKNEHLINNIVNGITIQGMIRWI